ncbi:MAG: TIM barrel protein [Bryobacterales bacterium]|nr:TIM barrel protein [Bryobacterales bacterium]
MTRRTFLPLAGAAAAATQAQEMQKVARKGRLKQGVTRGCFGRGKALEDMAREAARLGAVSFDLVGPNDWPTVRKYGLVPSMVPGAGTIPVGSNRKENHAKMLEQFKENIPRAGAAGCPNVITFSGNRAGMGDEEAWENSVILLKQVTPLAEEKGVTICMELLNSKVDHKDYQCDHAVWGVELCRRVNSPRFKLLYDIYHMQIMDGDIIRTIRSNIQYFAHFHTAGNPGRHELDETQELQYRPIAQAIVDLGFQGYFCHEYSPLKDPLTSLDAALTLCDV